MGTFLMLTQQGQSRGSFGRQIEQFRTCMHTSHTTHTYTYTLFSHLCM